VLENFLKPIRVRREAHARDLEPVRSIVRAGTVRGRERAARTLADVRRAMRLGDF
jgi:tryptophanyl-tRNA synthetase